MIHSTENTLWDEDCIPMVQELLGNKGGDLIAEDVKMISVEKYEHFAGGEESYLYEFLIKNHEDSSNNFIRYFATLSNDNEISDESALTNLISWARADSGKIISNEFDGDTYVVGEVKYNAKYKRN